LPNVPGMTSADTEYEGLLLGLEWFLHALSSEQDDGSNNSVLNEWNDTISNEHQLLGPKLTIRGDCKAVIDQLKSRSVPRKMETKYNLAMDRLNTIKDAYAEHQQRRMNGNLNVADVPVPVHELSLCFEHVPRGSNKFCDALCKLVINQKQAEIVESIQDLIRLGDNDASERTYISAKVRHGKMSKKKRLSHTKNDFFRQALNNICENPQMCHSSRLALACELTKASTSQEDDVVLRELSTLFLQMLQRWSGIYYLENAHGSVCKDTLRRVSIACKKLSRRYSGHPEESSFFADKHGILCDGIASIFEFCTNKKSNCNASMDATENDILLPYLDISEIISGVDGETSRSELVNWYMLKDKVEFRGNAVE